VTYLPAALQCIQDHLDPNVIDLNPNVSLSTKLRHAQKALKKAKREADHLRQQHLDSLLNEAIAANHEKHSKALKYLIRAERNRQCYARFRHHMKPKSAGGLAFVTVTTSNGKQQPLLDHEDIEDMLLEYSRTHFATAEGSPFMCDPLNCLLQYDGLTPFRDLVYKGSPAVAEYKLDEQTTVILQNLRNKIKNQDNAGHPLDYKMLMNGIKKWPERTSTSPSGRHLGIYKTLQKHVAKKKKNTNDESEDDDTTGLLWQGRDILFLIFDIMTITLKHTYPLQ